MAYGTIRFVALAVLAAAALHGCGPRGTCPSGASMPTAGTMDYCGPSGCTSRCDVDAAWADLYRIETQRDFDRVVLQADRPVLVAFYTHDCEYCEALAPKVLRLAEDYRDGVDFCCLCKVDSEEVVAPYHLRGYPTVILFRNGEEARRWLGDRPDTDYRTVLEALGAETASHESPSP